MGERQRRRSHPTSSAGRPWSGTRPTLPCLEAAAKRASGQATTPISRHYCTMRPMAPSLVAQRHLAGGAAACREDGHPVQQDREQSTWQPDDRSPSPPDDQLAIPRSRWPLRHPDASPVHIPPPLPKWRRCRPDWSAAAPGVRAVPRFRLTLDSCRFARRECDGVENRLEIRRVR
jgi:hypothetical protein